MPYINHAMARSMRSSCPKQPSHGDDQAPTIKTNRVIRTMPGAAPNGATVIYKEPDERIRLEYRCEITLRKLFFLRSLIQAQYAQMMSVAPTFPKDEMKFMFDAFKFDLTKPLAKDGDCERIYPASADKEAAQLMLRLYPVSELDPKNSLYLRLLRHIFKKHPYILRTYEIFHDARDVYIFQEIADLGNMVDYLAKSGQPLSEVKTLVHGKQLWRAMDFLGDQAIVHRNIQPANLLLKSEPLQVGHELYLKLTGFRSALIYWDTKADDIHYCPCLPVDRHRSGQYQAPEVYGNPAREEFDPIIADTWSFGASLYYMLTRSYPYNCEGKCEDIDREIETNIDKIGSLSAQGKKSLHQLLRANANNRMPFDFIRKDAWIQSASSNSGRTLQAAAATNADSKKAAEQSTKPSSRSDASRKNH